MEYYDYRDIEAAAIGQWPEILAAFGVEFRPKQKAGPCPLCGGHDRAHYKETAGKVLLYCRHCGTTWGDQLLMELCFHHDFGRMCQELGDYLHCTPTEKQQQRRTQARVAQASGSTIEDIDAMITKARAVGASAVDAMDTSPFLLNYGIVSPYYAAPSINGALFPLTISGQLVDWLIVNEQRQSLASGEYFAPRGSRYVLKPESEPGANIFITPDIIDAHYLFQCGNRSNIVICCGSARNIGHTAASLPDKYRAIAAVPFEYDALDALATESLPFILPDEHGRFFCEVDYKCKPERIYSKNWLQQFIDKAQ